MSNSKQRLLIVEDDESLSQWIADYLTQNNYDIYIEHDGARAINRINELCPDLVILDVMLPSKSGFDICRELKPAHSVPVLMLTARDDEVDQVVGLELGADDYVIKPVQPRVLLARVQAILRRASMIDSAEAHNSLLLFDFLSIDNSARKVSYNNKTVPISDAEFDLLWLLADRAGEPMSRDYILRTLRGINYDGLDRSIDTRVSQLRRKLEEYTGHSDKIKTVRGKGYLFVSSGWQ